MSEYEKALRKMEAACEAWMRVSIYTEEGRKARVAKDEACREWQAVKMDCQREFLES